MEQVDGNKKIEKTNSVESEFDFLLKEQQREMSASENSFRTLKIIAILFVIGIVLSVLFISARALRDNNNTTPVADRTGTGVFNPLQQGVLEGPLRGKIREVFYPFNETPSPQEQFELVDENNERIAFVYSTSNDLSLLVDVEVEIDGELRRRTSEGYDVILVRSLILKR